MSAENKAVVRRFVEEVQNNHDIDAVDELFSPDMVNHTPMPVPGIENTNEGFKQFFSAMLAAFPDAHFTIHDQVAEGDTVVTRKTFHGTNEGEFMGMPATGRQVSMDIIDIWRVADGRLTEHWGVLDQLGTMQQLGVIPAPGQG